ncbi:MAG: CcoQ/FixQ family Cbb3-type cytochrome c oxidase assembly chaperone [Burkholderiaceae bacterium]|nr:CcoQ/FixQ family Cbb3-type cytochrome c oxidase assembly chaperone [Burkholderiaceae bacterium]
MLGLINGVGTALALITFVGIVWWAFSRGRADANYEASMLPFALPDENLMENNEGRSHE